MNDIISNAKLMWQEGDPEGAIALLKSPSLNKNTDAVFLMGEIYYSIQNWGASLNCFRRCLQLNPDLKAAQTYVELITNILSFFHTDQFNP
jgi:tetratricopeptide (TPR) repeat protein